MPITVTPNTTNVTISVGGTTTAAVSTSGSTAVTISATGPTGPAGADGTGNGSLTSTDQLTEGSSNLYHTSSRARASISVSGNGISYNSSTGAISSLSTEIVGLSPGISVNNVPKFGSDVATAEYLKVSGVTVISRSVAEVLSDIGAVASSAVSTFGGTLIDDADANAARTTLGLGTAATSATGDFSPVAGSSSIVTTGTIATGTWNATAIEDTKLDLRVDHGVTFDGQGSVIESAKTVLVPVERAGVIKAATLVGDASGAITITITKYDPAADATTLGSPSAVGTIALATKIINRDTTLSGWTLAVAEGDILAFTTGGTIATVTRVTCKLKLELA